MRKDDDHDTEHHNSDSTNSTDGEWEQVDADNAIITFDTVGQNEEGFYDGESTVHNKKKDEDIPVFCFHREDGVRWRTWANKADLQQKMAVMKPAPIRPRGVPRAPRRGSREAFV